ncbi:heavy metal translocating P-type ATPase [Sphingobium sp. DEHP117]|uniref:heavy metal translocating P-type ATPase n=1 Tax=Sphingobium sp. DEHP117 TaxID=2993436 RepID=UPI0027D5023E|nr:copper-translocating P-type ATPase [Sphingobium sp. DEHP117]MDQ4420908.1 heavy metal translocating P-type ATPase [Sphingobium sp. DEHP117]
MNHLAHPTDFTTPERHLEDSRFAVPGMRCAGCISKLESGIGLLPGVAAARVNFSAKQLAVSHDDSIDDRALIAEIGKLGFDAQPLSVNPLGTDHEERKRLTRALGVSGFGMMNIMLLSVSIWSGAADITRDLFHWLSAMIAVPVVAYAGRPFFSSALMVLRHGRTNMDVPISIGVILATGMSLYETMLGGREAYFEGAVMLLFFLLAGRVLDAMMRDRARAGIEALLRNQAPGALVIGATGATRWVKAADLQAGERMLVAAGENLAADGIIEDGETMCDLSLISGESAPQPRAVGDTVLAGSVNLSAPVTVRITAAGPDTIIADIARLMDEAGQSRGRYVRIADRAAKLYAPAVHSLAALSCAGWLIAGAGWHQALTIATAVLIITCPCALGLAVPVSQVVAAGALMRRGILVKDGSALERFAKVDRVLFDKTGTLTLGRMTPLNLDALAAEEQSVALALAQSSRHPISRALHSALSARGVVAATVEQIGEEQGVGVHGLWRGQRVALERPSGQIAATGATTRFVIGARHVDLSFTDALRPDAREAVTRLGLIGTPASIISGDRTEAVGTVAHQLGLTAQARALPQDKIAAIRRLQAGGHQVLMVGDGLNDGPALAAANASLAPGSATDMGQQAADAVFTGDSLSAVPVMIAAARRTMRVVKENFVLAIGYNVLAVPLAIAGVVTPLIAAIAMSTSSVIVIANALRLKRCAQ